MNVSLMRREKSIYFKLFQLRENNLFQLREINLRISTYIHICMDEQYRDMVMLNAFANNEIRMVIYILELHQNPYSALHCMFQCLAATHSSSPVRHCGLVESGRIWDGTGCEFDSWQCRIHIPCS